MLADYQTGSILEHRVQVLHVHIAALATFAIVCVGFRQLECRQVALLLADELVDALHLWCVDKGTLYTYRLAAVQIEHVASTYQLLCARTVQNGTRVYHGTYAEGYTAWEVGLDGTRNDVRRRTLGSDDHVDAYGTGQLCNTCNRQLYLLACRHNQVTELINDNDDIWHVLMSVLRIQLAVNELLVILLNIARLSHRL